MKSELKFKKVNVSQIAASLKQAQDVHHNGDNLQSKFSLNFIFPCQSLAAKAVFEEVFTVLNASHPARYFLIELDDELTDIEASIAVYTTNLSEGLLNTSEIVCLKTPVSMQNAIPSIIRSQRIPGIPTELILADANLKQNSLSTYLPLVEKIIFDSRLINPNTDFFNGLLLQNLNLVDLRWAALSPWREQLREAFDRPVLMSKLSELYSIKILAKENKSCHLKASYLLAGWLMHSMGCTLSSLGSNGFECEFEDGRKIVLLFSSVDNQNYAEISMLEFCFNSQNTNLVLNLSYQNSYLQTTIKLEDPLKVSRALAKEDAFALALKRIFSIGESMENYKEALKGAL
ncbi:MAG: glucose-6-phosphate dehydrogenase assembly protein OpcA, partial [Bdellovibrionales bacterium]|nr:glucose-6-phosphate dehydrogenase assembly protein OpcA [Bdellovibrionales bacterium]